MPELWFHIQWSAFGTWLPGDPRGFRSHQHRIHSHGNYKNPPPEGEHRGLLLHAERTMHKPAISFDRKTRILLRDAIVTVSQSKDLHLRCVAVSSNHVHALMRIDPDRIVSIIGNIKRSSSHAIRDRIPGRVWAARKHVNPIRDQSYLAQTEQYILAHQSKENAATWHDRIGYSK